MYVEVVVLVLEDVVVVIEVVVIIEAVRVVVVVFTSTAKSLWHIGDPSFILQLENKCLRN